MQMKNKKLNLGCGNILMKGYINVDNNSNCKPDIVHDLNKYPYPFKDNYFNEIYLDHVIEHLDNPLLVLQELYRISKKNCIILIKCPHFSCNWLHPGHKSPISSKLFDYTKKGNTERYGECNFKVKEISLYWIRNRKDYLEYRNILIKIINSIINFFANTNIGITERFWCYWVGGFEEIFFKVKVIK